MKNLLLKSIHSGNQTDSANLISEMVMLHKKGILTDEELATLIRLIGAEYVESEFNEMINRFERKIYPYFSKTSYV